MSRFCFSAACFACVVMVNLSTAPIAFAAPVRILAAESVYGQVATAIAGDRAVVTSVLNSPTQDPHDFEARPSTARQAAQADIVEVNGAGYDPWMDRLLAASEVPGREVITVAALGAPGNSPDAHLWYNPATMPRFAIALAAALIRHDPPGDAIYRRNLLGFLGSMTQLQTRITSFRARFAGVPITATEPVFTAMATALGLQMRGQRFQLAVMNGTEPRASDVAAMDADLRQRKVRALISNAQVADAATLRLVALARQFAIPVVAITETLPPGQTYVGWMQGQLDTLERALAKP